MSKKELKIEAAKTPATIEATTEAAKTPATIEAANPDPDPEPELSPEKLFAKAFGADGVLIIVDKGFRDGDIRYATGRLATADELTQFLSSKVKPESGASRNSDGPSAAAMRSEYIEDLAGTNDLTVVKTFVEKWGADEYAEIRDTNVGSRIFGKAERKLDRLEKAAKKAEDDKKAETEKTKLVADAAAAKPKADLASEAPSAPKGKVTKAGQDAAVPTPA